MGRTFLDAGSFWQSVNDTLSKFFFSMRILADEAPKMFGLLHILMLIAAFVCIPLLVWALRNISDKTFRRIMLGIGIFLLSTEIYKMFYTYYVECHQSIGDSMYRLSFQLCSLPIYMTFMVAFMKDGKVRNALLNFMMTYTLLAGFITCVYPSTIFTDEMLISVHSCIWHTLLVFIGVLIGATGRGGKTLKDFRGAFFVFLICVQIAFDLNVIFGKFGTVNMFFIGPVVEPSLPILADIARAAGWQIHLPVYVFALTAGAFIFFLLFYLINKRKEKKALKATTVEVSRAEDSSASTHEKSA